MIIKSLRVKRKRVKFLQPKESINHKEFRKNVRSGDILLTRSSNNVLSLIHSIALGTPVAHVGMAVVVNEGDENTAVFMFESGAPRGAQLRNLDDYMNDGPDYVWWRRMRGDDETREKIVSNMERLSHVAYSWKFLKELPIILLGIEFPGAIEEGKQISASCADLIANVLINSGVIKSKHKTWLPMHFIDDNQFDWGEKGVLYDHPINVIFS